MILLWNSADMNIELTFVNGDVYDTVHWQADRTLARDMLAFLQLQFESRGITYRDLEGIGVFRGPGSFTGLRIGLTVLNTVAHAEHIPIVGAVDDEWRHTCVNRLRAGEDDGIVMPEYGAPAHVTKPRK